ncbi:HYR domain-containing protein [Flavobacterium faecale]|uniref:HYR domain-containing protein n=1 Tax=Flavobacterium faecale TaxID=1355330 RepID=UPI003AAEEC94
MKKKYLNFIFLLLISFSVFSQNLGDYKSVSNGDWSSASSWQVWNGSVWSIATNYPGQNPGTYAVNVASTHTITIATNLSTSSIGAVIVNGTLKLSPSPNPNTITLTTPSINIDGGILNFDTNKIRLNLPSYAVITLENSGMINGKCTNNDEIYIGSNKYAACVGGGAGVYTFGEVVAAGGNVNATISNPITNPTNINTCSLINLTGGYTGTETGVTYKWILRLPDETFSIIASGTLATSANTTSTSFTPSKSGEYLVTLEITTKASATNIETRTFNVTDTTNPTITPPATVNTTTNTNCTATGVSLGTPLTADNCGVASVTNDAPLAFPIGNTTVTWTVTDTTGNTATANQTVTVTDNIAPTISCSGNLTPNVGAGTCTASVTTSNPTTADNCAVTKLTWNLTGATTGASAATGINNLGTQLFNLGTTTVNYRVEDAAGNFATCSYTVTVTDNIAPVLTAEANQNVTLDSGCMVTIPNLVDGSSATDNCAGTVISQSPTAGTTQAAVNNGTINVTVTATDLAGNIDSKIVVITAKDTTAPVLTAEANQNVTLDSGCMVTIPNLVDGSSATDNCAGTVISQSPTAGTTQAAVHNGTINVTVTATDLAGNIDSKIVVITAKDTTAPVLTAEANQNVTLDSGCMVTIPNLVDGSSATDNCAGTVISQSPTAGTTQAAVNNGTINVTVTATDLAGNIDSKIVVITAKDTTAPVLTAEANQNVTLDSGCMVTIPNLVDGSSATDNCAGTVISQSPTAGTTQAAVNNGTINVTVTATDLAGNIDSKIVVITAKDTTAPVLTAEANQNVTLDSGCMVTIPNLVDGSSATDNCAGTVISQSPAAGTTQTAVNNGTINVTVTATDLAGNIDSKIVVITAKDTTAPVLTAEANQNITLDSGCMVTIPNLVDGSSATDNCAGTVISQSPTAGTTQAAVNNGTINVTVTATDLAGNIDSKIVVITAKDTTAPVLTAEANQNVTLDSGCMVTIPNLVDGSSATDNCAGTVISQSPTAGTTQAAVNNGTINVTVTATDLAGNIDSKIVVITAKDTTAPVLTAEANQNVTLDSGCMVTIPNLVDGSSATDNCAGTVISQSPTAGTTQAAVNNGTINVTVTATDLAGNIDSKIVVITAKDTTAPVLTAEANQNVTLDSGCMVTIPNLVDGSSATDNCAGTVISQSPTAGTTQVAVHNGTINVTVTATDLAGNIDSKIVVITAKDTTAPVLTAEANQNVTLDSGCMVTIPNLVDGSSATDNCAGTVISQSPTAGTTQAAVNNGTINVTVTATDLAGNIDSKIVVITAKDTTAPVLTAEANQNVTLDNGCMVTIPNLVDGSSATDNCAGTVISQSPTAGTTQAAVHNGTINVTVTATDLAGNIDSKIVVITAKDTTAPVLTAEANQNVTLDSGCMVTIPNLVDGSSATDNCAGTVISQSPTAGTTQAAVNNGTINVTVTATDLAGNIDSKIVVITAKDTTTPVLTAEANQNVTLDSGCMVTIPNLVDGSSATDNCAGTVISQSPTAGTTQAAVNNGTINVTVTATDLAGNIDSKIVVITAKDTTAPVLTAGSNQTANTDTGVCTAAVAVTNVSFSDNCSGATISYTLTGATTKALTSGQVGTYTFNKGVTTINYTATDASGNTTTDSKTITISDITPPSISTGPNQTANTDTGICTASVLVMDASYSDNCAGSTIKYTLTGATTKTLTSGQVGTYTFNKGVTTINYTVTDAAGNTTTGSKTITINDVTPPSLTAGTNRTANTDTGVCTAAVAVTNASFSDNCSGATISYTLTGATTKALTSGQVGTYTFNKGVTTINYTATDASGNTTTDSKTITISDITPPTISTGSNQTANTDTGICTASVTVTDASFTDNCTGSTIAHTLTGATSKALTSGQVGTYTFNKGVTIINYTVTDASGNSISSSKTITVIDNQAPTISSLPALSGSCSVTISSAPTSPDNCGTITGTTSDITIPYTYSTPGFYVISWNFTDAAGNSKNISQSVTVIDNVAPVPSVASLPNINYTGCEILSSQITYPTAVDACNGTITGVPSIQFPYSVLGNTVITWSFTDATGNVSTQNQNLTMTSETINGGTMKGYLTSAGAGTASTEVNITSCSSGGNEIKMNLTGQTGTIVQWEKYEVGDGVWVSIANTANNYTVTFYPATTESTYFRALIKVGTCYKYSSSFYVRALPADQPPVLDQSVFNICLNESVNLVARRGYTIQEDAIAGKGGEFGTGQFPDKFNDDSWRIDGKASATYWTANGNATKDTNWAGTNPHPFGTITYDSGDPKFGIAQGDYSSDWIKKNNPQIYNGETKLETPIFSLKNMSAASLDFDQAYNLVSGDYMKLELSLDGGITYPITLQSFTGPKTWDWASPRNAGTGSSATKYNFKNDNSSFDLTPYVGQTKVRARWTFHGTSDKSVWAIDGITIPVEPVLDAIEWTDGIGNPGTPSIANGYLETSFTLTPEAPENINMVQLY